MPQSVDVSSLKRRACERIDELAPALICVSRQIYEHPEIAFEETWAAAWLSDLLEQHGFEVERGVGTLPTAFRASLTGAGAGPTIGLIQRVRRPCWTRSRLRSSLARDLGCRRRSRPDGGHAGSQRHGPSARHARGRGAFRQDASSCATASSRGSTPRLSSTRATARTSWRRCAPARRSGSPSPASTPTRRATRRKPSTR